MKINKCLKIVVLFFFSFPCSGQVKERPFIWSTDADRPFVLAKIENNKWANDFFSSLKKKVSVKLHEYGQNKDLYLRQIPLVWEQQKGMEYPAFHYLPLKDKKKHSLAVNWLVQNIQFATDCAVLYYLTEEKRYAQCALDISYSIVMGLKQTRWDESSRTNGGWIYPDDNLRELRYMASLPVVYDFIYPYIKSGGEAYNLVTGKTEQPDLAVYQFVFLTYCRSAVEHGHAGSNWSVLESPCLVQSALALDDLTLRNKYLDYYLNTSVKTQDCLYDVARVFKNQGDVWPETSQYSNGVSQLSTKLMYILSKYDSSLSLGMKYINIPWSLPRWNELIFPNGELVRFGDGKRHNGNSPSLYEIAYSLAELEKIGTLKKRIGGEIYMGISKGVYNRPTVSSNYSTAADPYYSPAMLLWAADKIEGVIEEKELPRTDNLSHAGLFLQRNLSSTGKPEDGLMAFVAGASHVHSHAGGMNIELYGKGEILGVDGGRGSYGTDIHENYSRLYAAHNCVISNGRSSSKGDWVNLGTSTVTKISMEPEPLDKAISSNYSYTTTGFIDKVDGKDNGIHERTLAVVRTSPTTGYYVDVYRAKSDVTHQFHDYLYHNIADTLFFSNSDLLFQKTPERYQSCATQNWVRNNSFRHPGWHFFSNVQTSVDYNQNLSGMFQARSLGTDGLNMRFFIVGEEKREYSVVDAPATFDVDAAYSEKTTPTIVIRRQGEAWKQPFSVIFEPTAGTSLDGSVQSVGRLGSRDSFKGFCVESQVGDKEFTQYIIVQEPQDTFVLKSLDLIYKGHFSIITFVNNVLHDIYVGNGCYVQVGNDEISTRDGQLADFYVEMKDGKLTSTAKRVTELRIN